MAIRDFKESSVPVSRVLYPASAGCLSFIYSVCHHTALAFYPLPRADDPQTAVYANLQPSGRTATPLPPCW